MDTTKVPHNRCPNTDKVSDAVAGLSVISGAVMSGYMLPYAVAVGLMSKHKWGLWNHRMSRDVIVI